MNEADSSGYEEPEAQGGNDSSTVGGGERIFIPSRRARAPSLLMDWEA